MMTPPRRKQHLWASSSSAPAQCQARLSPEILLHLSQEEGCRRQETMVLRLELSPIDADCTHAITAACVGAAGRRRQQRCGMGGPRPPPPNLNGPSRRRPPSPVTGNVPGCRPSDTRHGERPDQSGAPTRALKPTVHLPWPKSASPCRRPAYNRPHETAARALTTGGQICRPTHRPCLRHQEVSPRNALCAA